jgi:glycosyltransferase involved in cell wall biosynthesis
MRFSVIIPTFKRAQLLGDAIRAALAQTHTNREILVVDDGSPDDTRVSRRRLEKRYATFVRRTKENRPPSISAFRRAQETPSSYWMMMISSRGGPLPSMPRRWNEMPPRIFLLVGLSDFAVADRRHLPTSGMRNLFQRTIPAGWSSSRWRIAFFQIGLGQCGGKLK